MEKIKNKKKINQILGKGEITFLDPKSGYKYSLCALCPNDNNECSVNSFERTVSQERKITRVTFRCSICDKRFDASPDGMFLR
jgi:hypothetical protein